MASHAIDDAVSRLGQTVVAMQASARLVAASTADQHGRIALMAAQAETSSLGVDAIARHAALVEGLAGEAAALAPRPMSGSRPLWAVPRSWSARLPGSWVRSPRSARSATGRSSRDVG